MKTANSIALFALLLALTAGTLVAVHDVHQVLHTAKNGFSDAGSAARALENTSRQFDQTLATLTATADTVNAAANEQKANWQKTSLEAADTGRDLRMLIARTDRAFVDGTLFHLNKRTLPAVDAQIEGNGNQLRLTLAKVGDTADGMTAAAKTLDAQLGNPQIPELLGRIDMTAMHFETIAAHSETIAANFETMSGDMKIAVHRMAQPPTKVHTALNVAWTTAKFGSLFIP